MTIDELLSVNVDARDAGWDEKFLKELPSQRLRVLSPEPQQGPDGWPYLLVDLAARDAAAEPARLPLDWIASRGIGMAINPMRNPDGAPDFVLTYGMAWNFKETGAFLAAAPPPAAGPIAIADKQSLLAGPPSEAYLPKYARAILKQFFLDQGAFAPKALMVSADGTQFDLCFSIESLGAPPEREHAGILEAISWFLPAHYSLALLAESTLPGWQVL